ncbi:hypothetical protein PLICRDRAFT_542772 [Plicaturopsis crispa FD-325 SS-3]|nr:hypothetical protein PLICRDRAFT_542772 [Plicaturopsis crispa FD-325 SS-3]
MKTAIFTTLAAAALTGVSAVPTKRAAAVDDTAILNYALTLEHLESAFYEGALNKFDAAAFTKAGLPSWARGRFVEIAAHEKAHVDFLTKALGSKATAACEYSFPYTDPKSFAALSMALEGTGVTAYLGAAGLITNKDYLTAAGSILTTEARHVSWISGAVNKVNSWSGDLDVPLSLDQVYTIAAQFITKCPSSNPTLPVKAFATLTVPSAAPGKKVKPTFTRPDSVSSSTPLFLAFFTGLSQEFAPIGSDGMAMIPADLIGTVYTVVTTSGTKADDSNIVAGPAIMNFNFNSDGTLIQ